MAVQGFQIWNLESELPFLTIICFSCSAFQDSFSLDLISKIYSPSSQLEALKYTVFTPGTGVDLPGWPWEGGSALARGIPGGAEPQVGTVQGMARTISSTHFVQGSPDFSKKMWFFTKSLCIAREYHWRWYPDTIYNHPNSKRTLDFSNLSVAICLASILV